MEYILGGIMLIGLVTAHLVASVVLSHRIKAPPNLGKSYLPEIEALAGKITKFPVPQHRAEDRKVVTHE